MNGLRYEWVDEKKASLVNGRFVGIDSIEEKEENRRKIGGK